MKSIKKFFALLMLVAMLCSSGLSAFAANVADATIDTSRVGSIEVYKYDLTNAERDGVWEFTLIDGQQRLATLALLAKALQGKMRATGESGPDWLEQCLRVECADGPQPKVVLSRPDRATFAAVMLDGELPAEDADSLSERLQRLLRTPGRTHRGQ